LTAPSLTEQERAHAESIGDQQVTLAPTPDVRRPRVLIGSVVRKPPEVVRAFIHTLRWQRGNADLRALFLPNYAAHDVGAVEAQSLLSFEGSIIAQNVVPEDDGYAENVGGTRRWTPAAWHRIGALKNTILQYAVEQRFDFVWLVDADVLCDPYTLQSLLDSADAKLAVDHGTPAPIVSAVYWTRWTKAARESEVQHAGPQVWLRHPYVLSGHGFTEAEFRTRLIARQRTRVGGLGACTLIPASAITKGVNFSKECELPVGPMGDGEDRHFCYRATTRHVQLVADPWPDIWHAYHPEEYLEIPERLAALSREHPQQARVGDLVSARIEMLEPVPTGNGGQQRVEPRWVRGRLGTLAVLPQIEEVIAGLSCGEAAIERIHFPAHHDYPPLRGLTRLAHIRLLDAKSWGVPPTIDLELAVGSASGAILDGTTLTEAQTAAVIEDGRRSPA